ncbi:hypothetical protein RclHR1_32300001 [Rhizophagus clarus]|uniref:Uncharacterized protein n=1 Tax=Rhizophagus clarus TaxID=94130 RepID=A0A2Z6RMW5_9GLOM|nr:hypothetical protein RclHR1_32300001 [Rhizophagus clarus]
MDLGLTKIKPKASTQQIMAANVLGTVYFLSSSAFLDTIIFSALEQISRDVEELIDTINKMHQLAMTEITSNKGMNHQNPPDNLPNIDMDMDAQQQLNTALSTPLSPNPVRSTEPKTF